MKHTKEPWHAAPTGSVMQGYGQPFGVVQYSQSILVCGCFGDIPGGHETAEANSERIVDCVNAMAGIQNPAAVRECVDSLTDALEFIQSSGLNGAAQTVARAKSALASLNQTEKEI